MPRPSHGQTGLLFLSLRSLQAISLLVTLSLTSRFITTLIETSQTNPPSPLIAILVITILSCIYCILSLFLYFDHQLPLLPSISVDGGLFLAMLISAVVLGKPLSFVSCKALVGQATQVVYDVGTGLSKAPVAATAAAYAGPTPTTLYKYTTTTVAQAAATIAATLTPEASTQVKESDGNMYTISGRSVGNSIKLAARDIIIKTPDYKDLIPQGTVGDCNMMKAVWGFSIVLAVLFFVSMVALGFIWRAEKRPARKMGV
ncbi:hypothetical protein FPQ18DRAFT_340678 [Pyronema domesticum]|nr:hypothetical protein FPQ18DRAFT_340678 [Pyronema domesticum]